MRSTLGGNIFLLFFNAVCFYPSIVLWRCIFQYTRMWYKSTSNNLLGWCCSVRLGIYHNFCWYYCCCWSRQWNHIIEICNKFIYSDLLRKKNSPWDEINIVFSKPIIANLKGGLNFFSLTWSIFFGIEHVEFTSICLHFNVVHVRICTFILKTKHRW